jgi:general secretion pathway protein C
MRVTLSPAALRLVRRIPKTTVYSGLEILFLCLLAVQCARLVWTVVTPVSPLGDWKASMPQRAAPVPVDVFAAFDPFFRLSSQTGPLQVTSLNIKLFGVREDRASGRGSAIISTPDGQQRSFAVGDEIVPGVTLTGVSFDSVTISRNGTSEQLFLDQSPPAPVVGGTISAPAATSTAAPPPPIPAPPPLPVVSAPPRTGRAAGPLIQPTAAQPARKYP